MRPLRNIHTQLVDLGKEHIPQEQAGAFFNTILQVSCSFWQEMDNMATNPGPPSEPDSSQPMGLPSGIIGRTIPPGPSQLLGQLNSVLGGAGHSRTRMPERAGFFADSDQI